MKFMKIKIMFVIAVIFAILTSAVSSQQLEKDGHDWRYEREKIFDVNSQGLLKTEDLTGDITVSSWKENKVKVIETLILDAYSEKDAEGMVEKYQADFVVRDDVVLIIHEGGYGRRNRFNFYYEIWIPEQFNCDLETEGGDIEIEGVLGAVKSRTAGGDVELKNLGGPVHAQSGGGDVDAISVKKKLKIQTGGGDIFVENVMAQCQVQTGGGDIDLSHVKGEVTIQTGGGDIDVQDCESSLTIQTGGGDIDVMNVSNGLEIQTGGGDIDLQQITGKSLISTGGGDVVVNSIQGEINVTTGGGSVELSDVKGAIKVRTGGGDVYAEVTLKDFSVDHSVEIETGCGEIELVLPAKIPVSVKVVLETKDRNWEDYSIQSDFPLKIETQKEGWHKRVMATGDLNGGGDPVYIYSNCGDIHITKQ